MEGDSILFGSHAALSGCRPRWHSEPHHVALLRTVLCQNLRHGDHVWCHCRNQPANSQAFIDSACRPAPLSPCRATPDTFEWPHPWVPWDWWRLQWPWKQVAWLGQGVELPWKSEVWQITCFMITKKTTTWFAPGNIQWSGRSGDVSRMCATTQILDLRLACAPWEFVPFSSYVVVQCLWHARCFGSAQTVAWHHICARHRAAEWG